jgi:hypothetical protein
MMSEDNQSDQVEASKSGLVKDVALDVGKGLLSETKITLKWALVGAFIGALIVGGAGFWFLGLKGLGMGALIGAVIGAIAGGGLYLWWGTPDL